MSARRVVVLLITGVLLIAFAVWLSSKRHLERATLAGDPVLSGLDKGAVNSITEVRLSKADGTKTTLKKGAADWMVAERDYPADSGKVRKLLLDLAALNVVEEKTRNPENFPLLGVEDLSSPKATGTLVEAVTAAKTFSLIVGKASGAKSGFVRVAKAEQSLLAAPQLAVDADPRRWLDHTLIDIAQERVREVAVRPADGPGYTLSREKKEQADFTVAGIPKGRELSGPAVADPTAGALGSVSLDDVRRLPDPAPSPLAHAVFRTFDGLEIDVAGHKDGSRTFVFFVPKSTAKETEAEVQALDARLKGWEFEIPGYKYDGIFRPLEELLKKPPEPAAKSAGKSGKTAGKIAGKAAAKSAADAPEPASTGASEQQ